MHSIYIYTHIHTYNEHIYKCIVHTYIYIHTFIHNRTHAYTSVNSMVVSLGADTSAFRAQGCNRVKELRVKRPVLPYSVHTTQFAMTVVLNQSIFYHPHRRLSKTHTLPRRPPPNITPLHTMLLSLNHTCTQGGSMFKTQHSEPT
jgi:hypothetical protein